MSSREDFFDGVGGVRIFWKAWLPASPPRAVIVIAHGAGEHLGRYEHVASRLVAEGYAVYALDHRGHGRSSGHRAHADRMYNLVADLDSFVVFAAGEHPGVPVFLLGHSLGGAIALSYAIRHQERLTGLILSAALAALDAAPPPMRIAARVLSVVAPRLPVIAVDPALVSRDPGVVRAYETDPLVFHGKLSARTVAEIAAAVESFPAGVATITVPVLILHGSADGLVPPRASEMVAERIGSEDKTVKSYEGLYHEILNEPEQGQVLDDITAWLDARAPASAPATTS